MKRTLLSMFVLTASSGMAFAGHGMEFNGDINIQTVTSACTTAQETAVNNLYHFRFNPPGLGGTNPNAGFALREDGGEQEYEFAGGVVVGTSYQAVTGYGIYRHGYSWNTTMRFTKQTPVTLTLSTLTVTLVGDIKDFDGVVGCNVHFTGTGVFHN